MKWSIVEKKIKSIWYIINKNFTLVELAVIIGLSIAISIGIYKGIIWMIQSSSMGSTFYRMVMKG